MAKDKQAFRRSAVASRGPSTKVIHWILGSRPRMTKWDLSLSKGRRLFVLHPQRLPSSFARDKLRRLTMREEQARYPG